MMKEFAIEQKELADVMLVILGPIVAVCNCNV